MALSGTTGNGYFGNSNYWIYISWTATQSITGNYSTVTAKLYIDSNASYNISASAKDGTVVVNGTTDSFSADPDIAGGSAKLLETYTKQVPHNDDGTKTFTLSGTFDLSGITVGSNLGKASISGSFTLDTIPRASTLTGGYSWTLGNATTFTIDRASTSFTHDIQVEVYDGSIYHTVETITGVATSYKWTPISTDTTSMADYLNNDTQSFDQVTRITVTTKDSTGAVIGTNQKAGLLSSPAASNITSSAVFTIENPVTVSINQVMSGVTHTLRFYVNNTLIHTQTGVGTSYTWTPTAGEITSMYNACLSTSAPPSRIEIDTLYGVQIIRKTDATKTGTAIVNVSTNSPTFSTITYLDNDTSVPSIPSITGNNQYIVQNKSKLRAQVLSANKAVGKNGATITKYIATFNGVPITVNTPFATDINFDFNLVNVSVNQNVTITAYDTRGLSTAVFKTVNIVAWSPPAINASALRTSGFQNETTLAINGTISPCNVNGTNVNAVDTTVANTNYQYGVKGSTLSAAIALTGLGGVVPNYSTTSVTINSPTGLDNTKTWTVVVNIKDKFGSNSQTITVTTGKPIFFIDDIMGSLGFGDYPANPNEFLVTGAIRFGGTHWVTSGGALILNNSDITQANGIYFNDVADDNNGEGLLFLKTGKTSGSAVLTDYDNFYLRDGYAYMNGAGLVTHDLTVGNVTAADTSSTLTIYNTGDGLILQSGNNLDKYNGTNILWKSQDNQSLGRIHYSGSSLTDLIARWTIYDETGAENTMVTLNASGVNSLTFNGHIYPDSDSARDLGTVTNRYRSIYLGSANTSGVFWSNDDGLTYDDGTNTFTFKADNGANAIVTCKTLTQTSDATLKTNFKEPDWVATDEIDRMDVREYNFISDETTVNLGVVIGKFEGGDGYVNPLLEVTNPDGYATMNLYGLTSMNTLAIQEINARLKKLEGVA